MRTPVVVYALSTGFWMPLSTTTAPIAITTAATQAIEKGLHGVPLGCRLIEHYSLFL